MKWLLIFLVFVAGVLYLLKQKKSSMDSPIPSPATAAEQAKTAAAQADILPERDPAKGSNMTMSQDTKTTLYELADDSAEKVRWAAIELLYRTGDPKTPVIIKNRLEHETENGVKLDIINRLLTQHKDKENLRLLAIAQNDLEAEVRLAALNAMAAYNRPEVLPYLNRALKDDDTDVKLKAMNALKTVQVAVEQQKRDADDKARKQAEELKKQQQQS